MDDFIETPRFDADISFGSKGGPGFKTNVFVGESPAETRTQNWTYSRGRWELSQEVRDLADMDVIRSFFYNAYGKARGFRFKDWSDYTLTDEVIGTGDGSNRVFNITKEYGSGTYLYTRRIFKPVSGTLSVKVNGSTVSDSTYTVNYTTGIITFNVPNTPPNGHDVAVTCEFDVPVRFDTDKMPVNYTGFGLQTWGTIPIVEILIDE